MEFSRQMFNLGPDFNEKELEAAYKEVKKKGKDLAIVEEAYNKLKQNLEDRCDADKIVERIMKNFPSVDEIVENAQTEEALEKRYNDNILRLLSFGPLLKEREKLKKELRDVALPSYEDDSKESLNAKLDYWTKYSLFVDVSEHLQKRFK